APGRSRTGSASVPAAEAVLPVAELLRGERPARYGKSQPALCSRRNGTGVASTIEIDIAEAAGSGGYPVPRPSSAGGEAAGMLRLDVESILCRRQELQLALLASAVPTRAALRAVEVPVREVGRQLFTGLISGPVYGRYAAAATAAAQRG